MKFKIFKFKTVNSTNSTAMRIIRSSNFNYGMVVSETQKKGKGQYGKKWISYKGNLFISFFFITTYPVVISRAFNGGNNKSIIIPCTFPLTIEDEVLAKEF